jgi:predicted RNA-binding protein with PIN domain
MLYALSDFPAGTWEAKRESLLRRLADQKPFGHHAVTVVFDSREGGGSQTRRGALQVVYTASETADDWLARHVRTVQNPRLCVVVSDDKGLRHMIGGTGAHWMSTEEFWRQAKTPRSPGRSHPASVDKDAITDELKKKWL